MRIPPATSFLRTGRIDFGESFQNVMLSLRTNTTYISFDYDLCTMK